MHHWYSKKIFAIAIVSFFGLFLFVPCVDAARVHHSSPRTANYFLKWELTEVEARELAKWDLVVLDMEIQHRRPDLIRKMRVWNPDIMILVYITPQEIVRNAVSSFSNMRRELVSGVSSEWYLRDSAGKRLSWWPGTYIFNVSNKAPIHDGKRLNTYIVDFVVDELLSTNLWDGVFYDNAWDGIVHFVGSDVDYDLDGTVDTNLDATWQEGMRYIYAETRRRAPADTVLVGNGTSRAYRDDLDGNMLENFIPGAWTNTMNTYAFNDGVGRYNIINANTGNNGGGKTSYQAMRFGLGSTLLQDGYYSYDFGDQEHGQLWYYDEYDIDLGNPTSPSVSSEGHTSYQKDIWRRDFEHGIALVNSTHGHTTVDLGGEYEKIHGSQDTLVNDGMIVNEVDLDSLDAVLLLKTFSSLNDTIFTNGQFARFFRADGSRVRNGFFVFEDAFQGGYQVAHVDLNGNGKRDLLIVRGNSIRAWRDDGQPYMKIYPYGTGYPGKLRIALGDINNNDMLELYVAPESGYPAPIKVYNRNGQQMKNDWYPFGTSYKGGYSIALGNLYNSFSQNLLIGSGVGKAPEVHVYDQFYTPVRTIDVFERSFAGGIDIASGDVDADGKAEIVVGAGPGKGPLIKVLEGDGSEIHSFNAYTTFEKQGIHVEVLDVDFDGKDDIVGFSPDVGF